MSLGSVQIPFEDVLKILFDSADIKQSWTLIVLKLRLPRAITAIAVGMALSLSGLQMQTFFHNPLAGPFVLGISSGASYKRSWPRTSSEDGAGRSTGWEHWCIIPISITIAPHHTIIVQTPRFGCNKTMVWV